MILMGVVNLTPDSFFAPSRAASVNEALARVADLRSRGCSIIDFGAVSTRPGAADVTVDTEWRRLRPVLKAVEGRISVDTTSSTIVRRAYKLLGPFIVNDISAGEDDPEMLPTVAELGLSYIAMHKRGTPRTMDSLTDYPQGVVAAVEEYFEAFASKAQRMGIEDWILDPGFGFAKTNAQNWELLENLHRFKRFGRPLLAGVADKRFTREREAGYAERLAEEQGADILRIH